MSGRMEFNYCTKSLSGKIRKNAPMQLLLMGDFSGRANRGEMAAGNSFAGLSLSTVDVDNFDQLMAHYLPCLNIPIDGTDGGQLRVEFKDLDDFHPDMLYQRLDLFQALRQLREKLSNPKTFIQAASELQQEPRVAAPLTSQHLNSVEAAPAEAENNMFERLLGKAQSETEAAKSTPINSLDSFIRDIVAPHIVSTENMQQDAYIASVDDAISAQMRQLLHEPQFQQLESVWRSLHRLISNIETTEDMKVFVLDISKQEIEADLALAGEDLKSSGLYQLLVEQRIGLPGEEAWSVLAGDFNFSADEKDIRLLGALGAIAAQAGAPFLAAADPQLLGCSSLAGNTSPEHWQDLDAEAAQHWQALRTSPMAPWIGLILPRILLRLPYGRKSDEIDAFTFEELTTLPAEHEHYLWGNSAYASLVLLAQAYQEQGWSMQPGDHLEIDDLPAYIFNNEGEQCLMPCAEVLLSERTGEIILSKGLMPMLSHRHRNIVRMMRFQSIAKPPASLAGPWH